MDIIVVYGPTGVGKTRWAWDMFPAAYSAPQKGWFDGYSGEETVIIDEMYGSRYSWSFLLQLLDRYRMLVPFKGGFHQFTSKRIVMTSNVHPEEWYKQSVTKVVWADSPLKRRITRLVHFTQFHRGAGLDLHPVEGPVDDPSRQVHSSQDVGCAGDDLSPEERTGIGGQSSFYIPPSPPLRREEPTEFEELFEVI